MSWSAWVRPESLAKTRKIIISFKEISVIRIGSSNSIPRIEVHRSVSMHPFDAFSYSNNLGIETQTYDLRKPNDSFLLPD